MDKKTFVLALFGVVLISGMVSASSTLINEYSVTTDALNISLLNVTQNISGYMKYDTWNSTNESYVSWFKWNITNSSYDNLLQTAMLYSTWNTSNLSYVTWARWNTTNATYIRNDIWNGQLNMTALTATNINGTTSNIRLMNTTNITVEGFINQNSSGKENIYFNRTCWIIKGMTSEMAIC